MESCEAETNLGKMPEAEDKGTDGVGDPLAALHLANIGFVVRARVLLDLKLDARLVGKVTDVLEGVDPFVASTGGETESVGLRGNGRRRRAVVVSRCRLLDGVNEAGSGLT
jgi:hypothetical protein